MYIVVQLKTSYYAVTNQEQPINIVVACSTALCVNIILRNSFFPSICATIDYGYNVIECETINHEQGFQITYKHLTMSSYPQPTTRTLAVEHLPLFMDLKKLLKAYAPDSDALPYTLSMISCLQAANDPTIPGTRPTTSPIILTIPISIRKPSQALPTSVRPRKTRKKLSSTRKGSIYTYHVQLYGLSPVKAPITAPRQGTPCLSTQAAVAFQNITGAPPDSSLTAEPGTIVSSPIMVDLITTSVAHPQNSGATKGQVLYAVDNTPTTARSLNALSLTDTIYDIDTSTDDNTDLFVAKNSDKD